MRRFMTLIALLFTISAVVGGSVAHAHRYVSTPIVVLNYVDAENQPILVVVEIQRGQIDLGAGIVMPCGQHHAIGATPPTLPAAPRCDLPASPVSSDATAWPSGPLLRPPISA